MTHAHRKIQTKQYSILDRPGEVHSSFLRAFQFYPQSAMKEYC